MLSVSELVEDPHYEARGLIATAVREDGQTFRQLGTVLAGTDRTRREFTLRDATVTDTDELLARAGLSAAAIAALHDEGVVA